MTVREFCVIMELEWWASFYGCYFDMDVSNPEEISILAVRMPQRVFKERSLDPEYFMQVRSRNSLKKAFYLNSYDLMEWLLNEADFTTH